MTEQVFYTIGEVAHMLGKSRKTLYKWRCEGRTKHGIVIDHGPEYTPGFGYTLEAVNKFINQLPARANGTELGD